MSKLHDKKSQYKSGLPVKPADPDEGATVLHLIWFWVQNKIYEWKLRRYEDNVFAETYRNIDNNSAARFDRTAFIRAMLQHRKGMKK